MRVLVGVVLCVSLFVWFYGILRPDKDRQTQAGRQGRQTDQIDKDRQADPGLEKP